MEPDDPGTPYITVITVCLNAETHISRALESVLGQSFDDYEYVIVDGGSSDGTLAIVQDFEPRFDGRLRWISEPDRGLYDAMNKGVRLSRGTLVGILNADDTYEPDALQRVVATHAANPGAGVIYGDDRTVDDAGLTRLRPTPNTIKLRDMLRDHVVHHHAAFVSADTYRRVGEYDTTYRIAADYDFFLRCAEAGVRFAKVDGVITNFSLQGVSHRNIRETDREATRVRIAHGVGSARAWARFYKRATAFWVYERFKGIDWFQRAYERYRALVSR